ncbi:type II secretion system protein [Pseudalkalibacillus sp. SCS-8]|uniref:competence type IV pilus major pilin ComGC n=1 Tax=Pseudalkalibacillus nanhaiensis TaxID=3115291 RepID=UPI0032DA7333
MVEVLSERKSVLKSQKGFTLVELLATIVILGIIAAIAVPSIGALMSNTKENAHEANIEQIEEAARLYVMAEDISSDDTVKVSKLVSDGYLEEMPEDPKTGSPYTGGSVEISFDANGKASYTGTLTSN